MVDIQIQSSGYVSEAGVLAFAHLSTEPGVMTRGP